MTVSSSFASKIVRNVVLEFYRNVMRYLNASLLFVHRERKSLRIEVNESSAACSEFSQVCCYFFLKDENENKDNKIY